MFNPAYNMLPRDSWAIQSNMCQRASDFALDATTQSMCCPSLSYCCPNSIESCADPRAILIDVNQLRVGRQQLEQAIVTGWV